MIFQSIEYLCFLSLLLAVYFWLPIRGQNLLLLAASYVFYGWVHPWYLILIAITTVFDWGCALGMDGSSTPANRKRFLVLSLGVNFAVLCVFKYFGFFVENVSTVLTAVHLMPDPWIIRIALPAGISFFTFQSASYAIDVYRRQTPSCRSLLEYATFVSFFPQLVAGPIERAGHMLPQFRSLRRPSLTSIRSGFVLFLWGLFQKIVIADSTAVLVGKVFSIKDPSFPVLWGGVLAFGVQIYADFSGYTAMARGSARLIGIELCQNFNHPGLAQSPGDFWRRWHISLSTWFRDYVFIPLGGSRSTSARVARNLVITFLLSGLWHGASWNFVLWGCFHGIVVAAWPHLARHLPWLDKSGGRAGVVLRVALTFAIVHIGWLMFREQSTVMLLHDLTLNPLAATASDWRVGGSIAVESLFYGLPLLVIFPVIERLGALPGSEDARMETWKWTFFQAAGAALIVLGLVALRCPVSSDFIYFQF